MHPKLRAFLEANGLRAEATEAEAWEYHKQLAADGVAYNGQERADDDPQPEPKRAAPAEPPVGVAAQIAAALAADRQRAAEIEEVCTVAGMEPEQVRALIASGATVDSARKAALDHLKANSLPIGSGAGRAQVGAESRDKFRSAALDGMLMRCGHQLDKPADGARDFRGMRLLDIVRESLELSGVRTRGMDPRTLASRALAPASTSDFPNLLSGLVNKSLIAAYNEAPATWRPMVAVSEATDFKTKHAIKLSGSPDLLALNENGEYRTADLSESSETYAVATRGRIIRLTRQMIINDDLGGFNRVAQMFGAAARRFENSVVYGLITANGAMSDGQNLFSAAHNNLLGAAALSAYNLAIARAAMRRQTGKNGEVLDVQPAFLLTGPEKETDAEILLRSPALPTGTMSSGVYNPWAGKLTPISDALITDPDAWYLFALPSQYPVIEVAWLMGDQAPFIDDEVDFASDSLGIKVRHDFGAGVVDWVGAQYNAGA